MVESFGISAVLVLNNDYQPVYAEEYGKEVAAGQFIGFDPLALNPLVAKAQASSLAEPEPYYSFIKRNGQLYWFAVCAISSELEQDALAEGSARPSLLFIRSFDDMSDEIATELGVRNLHWEVSAGSEANVVYLPVVDINKQPLGYLSWTLDLSGRSMLLQSLTWSPPLMICSLLLAWFIHRRFRLAYAKVESMTVEAALLKNSQQYFQSMANDAPVLIWEADDKANILYSNKRLTDLLGHSASSEQGLTLYQLVDKRDREVMRAFFENSLQNNDTKGHEFRMPDSQGDLYWLFVVCARQQGIADAEQRYIFSANDITERKAIENEAWYKANYDELSQLPNRSLFQNRLVQGLKTSERNKGSCALMFIDLDNFKNINDSLGHGAGDLVLKEAAHRIRESIRETDTAARLGGDEFVLLILAENNSPIFEQIASRVLKELAKPFSLEHSEAYLSASIGIAMYPEDGDNDETLMMNADTAMYHAKRAGRNQLSYYAPVMNAKLKAAMQMEIDLRKAINQSELFVVYQPIFNVAKQAMVGVEALVRWRKPDGSMVYPDEFISVAEQTGLIVLLGEFVLDKACQQLKAWRLAGYDLSMSINVSPAQLRDGEFVKFLNKTLLAYELNPQRVQLELTEQIFIENSDEVKSSLESIESLGVLLAIDDFGTGYSSLSYLQKLSVDVLKIDKSFMDLVIKDEDSAKLVKAMIAMAHSLNLVVVAEGVETQEQQDFLAEVGCEKGQGYFYGRPVEPEHLVQLHFDEPEVV